MFNSAGDHEEILILQDLSLSLQLKGIKKKKKLEEVFMFLTRCTTHAHIPRAMEMYIEDKSPHWQ